MFGCECAFNGLHGFFDEILFTSLFNFVESNFQDWRFRGHSSLWSFFMYGFGSFVIEWLYLSWKDKWYLPMPVRATIYVLWVYIWEFSFGLVLRYFAACPWDYSNRQWNLCGLITLQYFPAWFVASVYQEFVAEYLLTLSRDTSPTKRKGSWCPGHTKVNKELWTCLKESCVEGLGWWCCLGGGGSGWYFWPQGAFSVGYAEDLRRGL